MGERLWGMWALLELRRRCPNDDDGFHLLTNVISLATRSHTLSNPSLLLEVAPMALMQSCEKHY